MSSSQPTIQLASTLFQAHQSVFRNVPFLARVAWPWALALTAFLVAKNWVDFTYFQASNDSFESWDAVFWLVDEFIVLVCATPVAVALHRFIVLGDTTISAFRFDLWREHLLYLSVGILISLTVIAPIILAAQSVDYAIGPTDLSSPASVSTKTLEGADFEITEKPVNDMPDTGVNTAICVICTSIALIVGLTALLGLSYFPARLSVALPASAVGVRNSILSRSWAMTRGQFLKFFAGMIVTSWPVFLYAAPLAWIGSETSSDRIHYVVQMTSMSLVYVAAGLLWVAFLSVAYKGFTENSPKA